MDKSIDHYISAGHKSLDWHRQNIEKMKKCRFDTIAVHGIYSMQEALNFNQGSIIEPVYLSTSQAYRDSDEMEAALSYQLPTWCYSRIANPSIYYYEGVLSLLESYKTGVETNCVATSSGMSAIQSTVDAFLINFSDKLVSEANFVASCQLYGGTYQQFAIRKEQEKNIEWRKVINANNADEWASKIDKNTRFLYGELPSNPSLSFFDIKKVAEVAHSHNIPLIIDATVATPALLRPIEHGADIVIHSVTKSLFTSGFGIAGAIIAKKNITSNINNDEMKSDFCKYLKLLPNRDNGPNISPMNAILALNDIRWLRTRMDFLSRSTMKVAKFINTHKHIEDVQYLGLKTHPLHNLAKKYMFLVDSEYDELYMKKINRYGHLMSFTVKGGAESARRVFDAFQRIYRATDLGRIKSIATIPAISTHQQQGEEGRKIAQIPSNLIRLCIGGEHPDDIINDINQALEVLDGKKYFVSTPMYSAGGASSAKFSDK